tara:strand:+ start:3719 stop:4129 length:411 start_codon:yes stop_codon:yes gene_type:complete
MSMSKRFFSFLLSLVFLLSTTGISVYKHYCGDFLEGISIYHQDNPCIDDNESDGCSMGSAMSCCSDDMEFYQLTVDLHKVSNQKIEFDLQAFEVLNTLLLPVLVEEDEKILDIQKAPPELYELPIYKQNQQLIFYS